LLRVYFDQAIVNNWLMAKYEWAHEIAHYLERNGWTVFDFNVEVSHAFSSACRSHKNFQVNSFLLGINDSRNAAILSLQTSALSLDVDVE
jgi:hypothetical protein